METIISNYNLSSGRWEAYVGIRLFTSDDIIALRHNNISFQPRVITIDRLSLQTLYTNAMKTMRCYCYGPRYLWSACFIIALWRPKMWSVVSLGLRYGHGRPGEKTRYITGISSCSRDESSSPIARRMYRAPTGLRLYLGFDRMRWIYLRRSWCFGLIALSFNYWL